MPKKSNVDAHWHLVKAQSLVDNSYISDHLLDLIEDLSEDKVQWYLDQFADRLGKRGGKVPSDLTHYVRKPRLILKRTTREDVEKAFREIFPDSKIQKDHWYEDRLTILLDVLAEPCAPQVAMFAIAVDLHYGAVFQTCD